jgi:hypothetical protein
MNTIGSGNSGNSLSGGYNHPNSFNQQQHHVGHLGHQQGPGQLQQQHFGNSNFNNLNSTAAAMAAAAAASLGRSYN